MEKELWRVIRIEKKGESNRKERRGATVGFILNF